MCRLFAQITKNKESAGKWFFDAPVPFKDFSEKKINGGPHNSGWGIGWLEEGKWKIFKEGQDSVNKYDFDKVRKIKSNLILIHLRHASCGDNTTRNAHPFVYKNWIFEHNGGVERSSLINFLNNRFKDRIDNETDSEVYFFLIMQFYEEFGDILLAIKKTLELAKKYPYRGLNFILSDGKKVYVYRDVSPEHKDKYNYYCLHYLVSNKEVIVSSDPLDNENWIPLKLGELVVINSNLKIINLNIN